MEYNTQILKKARSAHYEDNEWQGLGKYNGSRLSLNDISYQRGLLDEYTYSSLRFNPVSHPPPYTCSQITLGNSSDSQNLLALGPAF